MPGGKLWAHDKGLLFQTEDGRYVSVENIRIDDGRMIKANRFGTDLNAAEEKLELNDEETKLVQILKTSWSDILRDMEIGDSTNFFDAGATSVGSTYF